MKLNGHENSTLPRLAWCARTRTGSPWVEVEHGTGVEIREHCFFEGAWSGLDAGQNFLDSPTFCGTGGHVGDDVASFSGSTDRISPIFSIRKGAVLHVSNSPFFAMVAANEEPDESYPFYFYDFVRCWRMGLYCRAGKLKLASRHRLRVHFGSVLHVGKNGNIRFSLPQPTVEPEDYSSYHALLLEEVRSVFRNAQAAERRHPLRPLAAISRGFDSSASAALASQAGCREAFTFTNSRSAVPTEDSGKDNAGILGMACREYDRWAHVEMAGLRDEEFALFGVSAPTPLAVLQNDLGGRLLVGGYWGDMIWDPQCSGLCDMMTMPWSRFLTGVGQLEFRLRAGYHILAPAAIGARHNRAIHRIALSPEMKPWWTQGKYNRPLAKRIAGEAGLPRAAFGVEKFANSHTSYTGAGGFSAGGLRAYREFIRARDGRAGKGRLAWWRLRVAWRHLLWACFSSKAKSHQKYTPLRRIFPFLGNTHPRIVPWDFLFTFAWTHQALRGRYRTPRSGG